MMKHHIALHIFNYCVYPFALSLFAGRNSEINSSNYSRKAKSRCERRNWVQADPFSCVFVSYDKWLGVGKIWLIYEIRVAHWPVLFRLWYGNSQASGCRPVPVKPFCHDLDKTIGIALSKCLRSLLVSFRLGCFNTFHSVVLKNRTRGKQSGECIEFPRISLTPFVHRRSDDKSPLPLLESMVLTRNNPFRSTDRGPSSRMVVAAIDTLTETLYE